jgi:hypothetical protein
LETFRAYRDADDGIREKIVILGSHWTKLELQLEFLRQISDQLDERLTESHFSLVEKLQGKLQQATSRLEVPAVTTSKPVRKWKYVRARKRLDELVTELDAWQNRFDPTWFLIMRSSSRDVDSALLDHRKRHEATTTTPSESTSPLNSMAALRTAIQLVDGGVGRTQNNKNDHKIGVDPGIDLSVNLEPIGMQGATETNIPFCSARVVVTKATSGLLIAEVISRLTGTDLDLVKTDVETLAKKLKHIDPDKFCLLRCYGVLKHRDASNRIQAMEMLYRAPERSAIGSPASLRQLLLQQRAISASAIIRVAKRLVQSVSYIHACDFVHKNIRPENVLVFPETASQSSEGLGLGSSYLLGFNEFRHMHFQTGLAGDRAWHRNLYRHPERQGSFVTERYVMQHDIYSLGVCLLELGLWRSFVWYPGSNDGSGAAPVPSLALGMSLSDIDFPQGRSATPLKLKEHLVVKARNELPPRLGDIYTDIVVACLTCMDPGNETFGNEQELMDEDGILIGVKFVEAVLLRIADIVI